MSAFFSSEKTISLVADLIVNSGDLRTWWSGKKFTKENAFKALVGLNRASLKYRYPCSYEEMLYEPRLDYSMKWNDDIPQTFLSLRCFLYQSCEGRCSESKLYKDLENICDDVAYHIAHQATKNKEWDLE